MFVKKAYFCKKSKTFQVKKNKTLIFLFVNILLIIGLAVFFIFSYLKQDCNIAYVNNNTLFEDFRMTREMRKIGEKEFDTKKRILDSLYLELQREDLSKEAKELLTKEFVDQRNEFDQFNNQFALEESHKIWSRINSYSEQFAKENNYKIVLGSNNKQNVIYADESIDVTKELLAYINKKYSGL